MIVRLPISCAVRH